MRFRIPPGGIRKSKESNVSFGFLPEESESQMNQTQALRSLYSIWHAPKVVSGVHVVKHVSQSFHLISDSSGRDPRVKGVKLSSRSLYSRTDFSGRNRSVQRVKFAHCRFCWLSDSSRRNPRVKGVKPSSSILYSRTNFFGGNRSVQKVKLLIAGLPGFRIPPGGIRESKESNAVSACSVGFRISPGGIRRPKGPKRRFSIKLPVLCGRAFLFLE